MSGVEFAAATPPAAPPAPSSGVEELAPPSAPRRRSLRLGKRSLTARIVAGVVSLVIVLVVLVTGGTYLALRSSLSSRLDQQLQTTAQGSLSTLFNAQPFRQPPSLPTAQPVFAVALLRDGEFFGYPKYTNLRSLKLSDDTETQLAATAEGSANTVRTTDGYELRVTTRQVAVTYEGNQLNLVVVIGLSTAEEHRTLRQTLLFEAGIGASAIALALAMTYAGVRFSLRGLRRVTTTAQEVAAELGPSGVALQRRVPVTEEGTEVAQLTDSLNTLLEATETQFAARVESEERMRQFLADASHELRTPLTSIRGYAELARMQRAVGREDEDNLGRIEAEGTRMSRLVEDLLLLARGDSPDAEPLRVPIEVTELVRDAVSSAHAAHADRVIEIDAMLPSAVLGDPDQLVRVVRNLITNAVVHTAPGPPIHVRAFVDGPGVAIQVVDSGPGLPPDEAAHVFERFWRADKARTRVRGGSGLGLSIVATIVQAHGGTVRFDSSVAAGSTVTVWLPAAT